MRHPYFTLIALAFFTISCKKNYLDSKIQDGIYKGTFQRSFVNKISNVTLKFSSNKFEGQSEFIHYPDICNGSFSINRDTARFENACFYTADFDWSYILSHKFKISVFGDSLIMKRQYNGIIYFYDIYKLKRE
jgi:hypothetical protein